MTRKPSPAVYLDQELEQSLKNLDSNHKFNKWIADMKSVLKENMLAGECIRKKQIPKYYVQRYGVNNLYHYDHPKGHRSCYTLTEHNNLGVCPLILDLKTHPEYSEIFGYRAKR
jgi:hypothetical protein